jgi:hypothetical protein
MVRVAFVLLGLFVVGASVSPAQAFMQGTSQEEAACRPDSSRYCRAQEPDTFAVLRCLQANRPRLSKACAKVLASHGQ